MCRDRPKSDPPTQMTSHSAEATYRATRTRVGTVIAVALAIAFVAWLLTRGDEGNSSSAGGAPAVAASLTDLKKLPASAGHQVYWAGRKPGNTYELTQTSRGDIYIRYLPSGVKVGDNRPNFLTVGTYPHPNAFATVTKASKRNGEFVSKIAGGGLAVASRKVPTSVYFAYPGSNYLIEVFHPSPAQARRVVLSGNVRPIP